MIELYIDWVDKSIPNPLGRIRKDCITKYSNILLYNCYTFIYFKGTTYFYLFILKDYWYVYNEWVDKSFH